MEQHYSIFSILFFVLYGGAIFIAMTASVYLLLRPVSVFDKDITPPLRLRRWTAASFATLATSHLWWLFIYYGQQGGDINRQILLCRVLDVIFPFAILFYSMIVMLQDRRRPLWSVAVFIALALSGLLVDYVYGAQALLASISLFVITILYFVITIAIAVRQYGQWLRRNYADLEHKEVWQTLSVITAFLPAIVIYSFCYVNIIYDILLELVDIILIFVMLWRVETLQSLEEPATSEDMSTNSEPVFDKLQLLLQQHCVDEQFYLYHDVTLSQLAAKLGTNTHYLSQHFRQQGLTYNSYINGLRIQHFISLYQEAAKTKHVVSASELANQCGFRSYSTFSRAFRQIKGKTVTEWMRSFTVV